jgi:hypothetical protein
MLFMVVLLCPLLLLGCSSKKPESAYVQNLSEFQVNSSNSTAGSSKPTTVGPGEPGMPVLPPQPILGSYLAASFETPATVNRGDCSVAVSEVNETFYSSLTDKPYQQVPIARADMLRTVVVECLGTASSEKFSASMNLNNSDRELVSTMLLSQPNEPVKFVARFSPDGNANGNGANATRLVLSKVDIAQIVIEAQRNVASADSASTVPETVSGPTSPAQPDSNVDVTPPQVLGIKIADHPTDSKLRLLQVSGAADNVRLADQPYSFDGGKVWTETNNFEIERRIWFDKSLIIVRDAAGNQTKLQGSIYTDN